MIGNIVIVGLGYVGLPLAVAFSKQYSVVGYDISLKKIKELQNGVDLMDEVSTETLTDSGIVFTSAPSCIADAHLVIVTVPTPIDVHKKPDLTPLESASRMIGTHLSSGSVVVYESTVYPGVTEDVCVPLLEEYSGLKFGVDFQVGYSPERLSPGDGARTLEKIVKVVAGSNAETLDLLTELYGSIVTAGIHRAPSIKVAEAAKVIENTQRDLNVALMNELAIIFHKMNINTLDVIEAASTKWNFVKMTPGLVGGHCIGVDPYYLTFKAQELGYHPEVILAGRRINDAMGAYIAQQTIKFLIQSDRPVKGAKVLILGITFKENVSDIRNSKVIDIINELKEYGVDVSVVDPLAHPEHTEAEYGVSLQGMSQLSSMDAVIFAVPHRRFFEPECRDKILKLSEKGCHIFVDVKSSFRELVPEHCFYWGL